MNKLLIKASKIDISIEPRVFLDEKDGLIRFIKNEFVFDNSDELPECTRYYPRVSKGRVL
jgi:hypothetical protein